MYLHFRVHQKGTFYHLFWGDFNSILISWQHSNSYLREILKLLYIYLPASLRLKVHRNDEIRCEIANLVMTLLKVT